MPPRLRSLGFLSPASSHVRRSLLLAGAAIVGTTAACVASTGEASPSEDEALLSNASDSRGRTVRVDLEGKDRTADAPPDRPRPSAGPSKAFWDAFNGNHYDALGGVIQGLEAELAKPPTSDSAGNDAWLPLTAGLAYLWQSAEAGRDPAFSPAQAQSNVTRALALLSEASVRNPTDRRADSFTGAIKINLGRALLEVPVPDVQAQGRSLLVDGNSILNKANAQWPEFHGFTYAFVRASSPRATAQELDESIAGTVSSMQYCFGPQVRYDGATQIALDVTSSVRRPQETSGFRRVCGNSWMVPHSSEGFFLIMGDIFARRGRPADLIAARQLYGNATVAKSFATWGFRSMLQDRMKSVEARAKAYKDGDPANDPFLGPRVSQCVVCHGNGAQARQDD